MHIKGPLKRLDDRVLPPIADVLARLGRGARRLRIIRAIAVLISLTVVLVAVYAAGRQPPATYPAAGQPVRLGVTDGESIPLYVADSHAKLDQLIAANASSTEPPSYVALVSTSAYVTPQRLATVLDGLPLRITYVIMRVPSPYQTKIIQLPAEEVPPDVVRGMLATAHERQQEASDDQMLLSQVVGSTLTDRTLRAQYQLGASVARIEEHSYQSQCACVYGVVVYAPPYTLGQLANRSGVRAVQAAPLHLTPDLATFQPPFPDQHKTAEPPPSSAPAMSGR